MSSTDRIPNLDEVAEARRQLGERVRRTPVWRWQGRHLDEAIASSTEVHLKLELFQYSGTFKPRAALLNMLALSPEQLGRGVTAVSAGNHAMAVSFACRALGSSAKVVMPRNANPYRVEECKAVDAEIVLVPDVHSAFEEVRRIEAEEGRSFIHPFEGYVTALGTATVGWELHQQVANLDAVVVPIGGGGLCAGVALATKLMQPDCLVFGVEPEGADSMHRSFAAGRPQGIEQVRTIADSLGAPHAEPYSFGLCHRFVDELVLIDDRQLRQAMRLLYDEMKLVVEPAGAAATAALCGPLSDRLSGKRVGLIVCGSNIDPDTFHRFIS
jgi:threonine dehydratase